MQWVFKLENIQNANIKHNKNRKEIVDRIQKLNCNSQNKLWNFPYDIWTGTVWDIDALE